MVVVVRCQDVFLPKSYSNSDSLFLLQQGTRSKFILSPQALSLRGKYCYISLHSTTTTPPTPLTPLTSTLTYTFFTSTYIFLSSNPSHDFLSCPYCIAITIPILLYYHSLPYLFLSYDLVFPTFPCLTIPYYKPHLRTYPSSTI